MRLLFIGDIVGKPGRKEVARLVPYLKEKLQIDKVIANYENMAHGFGLTPKIFGEFSGLIDIWTGGNHTFDRREIGQLLDQYPQLLRPLNYFEAPGNWYWEGEGLVVINGMGIYGMPYGKNPFREIPSLLERKGGEWGEKFIFIDFHGEATSEKNALFHLLKGRVGAIVGTHTHVGTDDLVIEEGTLYLTDIGLTGCRDGVIGIEPEAPLYNMVTGLKRPFDVPKKCKSIFQALFIEAEGGKAVSAFKIKAIDGGEPFIALRFPDSPSSL
jgi:metallophosphoesterase (TIGR00282 family)